jgi:hypothetical protein
MSATSAGRSRSNEKTVSRNDHFTADDAPTVPQVHHCIICGSTAIVTARRGPLVHVVCRDCDAEFDLEFNPPEAPHLRARIEIIKPPRRGAIDHPK